jgi:cation diffusion facilitator CzcD-associated flavoprotein CzcO
MASTAPTGETVPTQSSDTGASPDPATTVDVVIIGAGIIGLYQLWRAREAGFSVQVLEAADSVGGVWFWNRYPGALLDSESYTYGFLFSKPLFQGWEWTAHFAGQEELERYLNYAVDREDLRCHIRFGSRVDSAVWDDGSARWTVKTVDGYSVAGRFLVSASGVLSVPVIPSVAGLDDFGGETYFTSLWPEAPVDFKGKRVAVVGTGASGVQVVPTIADEVASLTVYQRSANWVTPLCNGPITDEEQEQLRENFDSMVDTIDKSTGGFLHIPYGKSSDGFTKAERWSHYEWVWSTRRGFDKLSSNYSDIFTSPAANADYCEFLAEKIRSIVRDPETAEKLIPKNDPYAGKRPPFGTGYYEAYNKPGVSLVDVTETPMVRVTETGIETTDGHREFDMIIWATGFDFGTGALLRMGIAGRGGLTLNEHWADGPATYLGIMAHGFPNLFFPGGPHGAAGNNPRYGGDQSDFAAHAMEYARAHGYTTVEVPADEEETWTDMVNATAKMSPFTEASYFYGTNIPGKPRRYLLNPMGRLKMRELIAEVTANDFAGFLR